MEVWTGLKQVNGCQGSENSRRQNRSVVFFVPGNKINIMLLSLSPRFFCCEELNTPGFSRGTKGEKRRCENDDGEKIELLIKLLSSEAGNCCFVHGDGYYFDSIAVKAFPTVSSSKRKVKF